MPVVKTKRIVSVSSEDVIHCGANLLSPSVSLQWLSDAVNQGNNKRIEIIIELAKLSRIKQIEIGNMGSAFVEVLVKSTIENGEDYLSLLPQSMLMSAEESKSNRNLTRTKLFLTDKLSKVAVEKKWQYLKIVCLQPFCGRQFGLRFIKLFSHSPTDETATPSFTSPGSSLTPGRLLSPPELMTTLSKLIRTGSPNQQSLSEPRPINKTTPSRRKRICNNDSQEFEFYGLETQSRLLKNTLKNDTSTIKDNSILCRIAADRGIGTKGKQGDSNDSGGFVKKKLLVKELPKVDSIDYLDSYKAKDNTQNTNRYAMMKLSSLDDSSEIGEGVLKGKRHAKRSVKIPSCQWINTRKKPCTDTVLPDGMKSLPQDNTKQNSLEAYFTKEVDQVITIDDDDDITTSSHSEPGDVSDDGLVNCPICSRRIPLYAVEMHASTCAENTFDKSSGKPLADNDVIWCN